MDVREKLIELLETVVSPKDVLCDGEVLVSTSRVADHLISHGVTVQQWIPVTERLPEKPGRYLICEELGRAMIAGWDTSRWFGGHSYSEFTVYKATHWMPLPEPPKGE